MSFTKIEKTLINILKEAIVRQEVLGDIDLKHQNEIGFMLSYYLKGILEKKRESVIREKWIDCVEWQSLQLINPNQTRGIGNLWWGFKSDVSKTFPGEFYCEMDLTDVGKKTVISYFFKFQIDGKKYELRK